jgi:hypothetical protein
MGPANDDRIEATGPAGRALPGDGPRRSGRRRWWLLGGAAVAAAAAAVVAVGFFGVHTLFVDDVVDEEGPVFASGATMPPDTTPATSPGEGGDGAAAGGDSAAAVVTLASGTFQGVGRYDGTGRVVVLSDGTDQRFVRFEDDFATSNGPDLFVYLGTGSGRYDDPDEYVDLGELRGNVGAQNYEIPAVHPGTGAPIDLDRFNHVAVWCRRFDVTFAVAPLSP